MLASSMERKNNSYISRARERREWYGREREEHNWRIKDVGKRTGILRGEVGMRKERMHDRTGCHQRWENKGSNRGKKGVRKGEWVAEKSATARARRKKNKNRERRAMP